MSYARAYFDHPAFKEHRKAKDAEQRLEVAVIERLNNIVRAIGQLGKALAGR